MTRVSTKGSTIRRVLMILLIASSTVFCEYLGLIEGINTYIYDMSFRLRGSRIPSEKITIAAIDERTLERLGRWPIRRVHYAGLLNRLREADVVAFDIIMTEHSEDDAILTEEIRRHGGVVLPLYIDSRMEIRYPVQSFSPFRVGHIHVAKGIDGVVREVYHTLFHNNKELPSLSSVVYEAAGGKPFHRSAGGKPFHRSTPAHGQGSAQSIIEMDGMRINYCGGPGVFERVSFSDILEGVYPSEHLRNKIVFVGVTAPGLFEEAFIPFSEQGRGIPGVELQAHALNTLLTGTPIKVIPSPIRWVFVFILALLIFVYSMKALERNAASAAFLLLFALSIVTYVLFAQFDLWLAPAIYYMIAILTFMMTYIFKFDDAICGLDFAYARIHPHLRWKKNTESHGEIRKGLSGVITPRGIHSKMLFLDEIMSQLLFEKELIDKALFSDVQGVILFDPDGKRVVMNDLTETLCSANSLKTESVEEFIKTFAPFVLEGEETERVHTPHAASQGGTSWTVSLPLPEKRFFKLHLSSFSIDGGRYLLFIFSDITKVKELEELKGQIVSIVSHELKTPMTSIQGFSELLTHNLQGEMREFADIIHRETVRLKRFIDTFLDISRIEDSRYPIHKTPVLLTEVLREVISALSPLASEQGTHIALDIALESSREVATVPVDRDLTTQCVLNLLENALKYSPRGRKVRVRLFEDQETLRIDVVDEGYGIREEELDKVFEKFYRSSSEETSKVKGSGIGLTFVKKAIEAQGGSVAVKSASGKGSTFSVLFPKTMKGE